MPGIRVGVVGGGAAGMMAAIVAARQGARVILLEGSARLGQKLLATGNGKCNLGNRKMDITEYHTSQPERLERILSKFDTEDVISFFQGIGVILKEKNGYLYPACEQAAVVQDALRYELKALQVEILTEQKVKTLKLHGEMGEIQVESGNRKFAFDKLILACGGKAAPKTGSDGSGFSLTKQMGHSLTPLVPALVQLRCREEYLKAVAGVRADAEVSLYRDGQYAASERGELQLTDYGVSGIPVFQLSRQANYILREKSEVEIVIDFLPDYSEEDYARLCTSRFLLLQGERSVEEFFTGMLHKKLMMSFIRQAGLRPSDSVQDADREKLLKVYELCRKFRLHVTGSNSYDNAQVCAGGVPLQEVTDVLESVKVPGVFFAGEILDVDGKCGGYNLHWAWCSGYVAAMAATARRA